MQTIVNLIYTMAARSLEAHAESGMTEKYHAVSAVVSELQAAASSQLWPSESVTYDAPHGTTFPVLQRLVLQVRSCRVSAIHDCVLGIPPVAFYWGVKHCESECRACDEDTSSGQTRNVRRCVLLFERVHRGCLWVRCVQVVDCMFVESDLKSKWVRCSSWVALCFVITTRVLRSVLGKTVVMVLLCHSSECGCFVCFS